MSTTVFVLFLLYFILYEPISGAYSFKKFLKKAAEHENARFPYYISLIIGLWIPTGILSLFVAFGSLDITDIGLTLPVLNTGLLPVWTAYIVFAIAAILLLLTAYQILALKVSPQYREKIRQVQLPDDLDVLLPKTIKEKRLWTFVSLSAAICEELLYRGLLIFILTNLFPAINVYWCIVIAGLVFGIAHIYQGLSGVVKTTVYGILFAALYMSVGSVLPGILLHFLTDFAAGNITPSTADHH